MRSNNKPVLSNGQLMWGALAAVALGAILAFMGPKPPPLPDHLLVNPSMEVV